jgi:hypothetical protein
MGYQDLLLARAGRKSKARRRAALAAVRAVVEEDRAPTLEGVAFVSRTAKALAEDAGLGWRDFAGARCSGCAGYTAEDVRRVIAGRRGG